MTFALSLSPEHGYVLLTSAAVSVQCFLSAAAVSSLRKKFNVPYPDSGDGRHAAKLSDEQWEQFHNAQRAHRNYTEQVGVTQSLLLAAGILHPKVATGLGLAYIAGRQLYYHGYVNQGPSGRVYGVLLLDGGLIGLLGTLIYSGLSLAGFI
ncbi:hypothetical protein K502DRAFT_367535 [Neoconidiobolus thromboides FSU 785]|nr:hypothetical protein K502DRAFT_367535 [Neoconidiobolus thromboides FSU 785]